MILRAASRWLAAGALVALAGCHPRRPPPDLSLDPAALLAEVKAAQARVVSVQGRARVRVDAPGGSGGTEMYVVAERPGQIRIEIYDFFGNVVSSLAVQDGRLASYDARQRRFLRGAATPANLATLIWVPISPGDLLTLLMGSSPLLDGAPASAEPGDGTVVLTIRKGDLVQRLEVGPGAALLSARLLRMAASGEARPSFEIEFSVHRTRAGQRVPTDISARYFKVGNEGFTLHWRDLEVNAPVDPTLFRLLPPAGAEVVDLPTDPP